MQKKRKMIIILGTILAIAIFVFIYIRLPKFGKNPSGKLLEKISQSENYAKKGFKNRKPTKLMTDGNALNTLYDFVFAKHKDLKPKKAINTNKTDLKELDIKQNLLVWMGHSSMYLQLDGMRILFDPVFGSAGPFRFMNRPFKGADVYQLNDMPSIDYLILTHDHWDHLEYNTIRDLLVQNERMKVICPLGVSSHLIKWGYSEDKIIELDWDESTKLANGIVINALPARHFSGRLSMSNPTLWTSYMIQSYVGNIYHSGDGSYDTHFKEIKDRFGKIDFAMLENGQYNKKWKNSHLMPDDLDKVIRELEPTDFITIHNSKYALAEHAWYEPMENVYHWTKNDSINLHCPRIGDVYYFDKDNDYHKAWWRES